jgi:anaerobic ribonucleoside-triphosphate reductase
MNKIFNCLTIINDTREEGYTVVLSLGAQYPAPLIKLVENMLNYYTNVEYLGLNSLCNIKNINYFINIKYQIKRSFKNSLIKNINNFIYLIA